jgi:RsiW-degrading membrane proteinase PrsW (M82 family)
VSLESLPTASLYAICFALGILPVGALLLALLLLDSYKLVRLRTVLAVLGTGAAVALVCLVLNPWLQRALGLDSGSFIRYVAPLVEEALKGTVILAMLALRRLGFLVDAAIFGFAVGAGFATVENIHYTLVLADPDLAIWTIRGFGTAVMHGGATAVLAIVAKALSERLDSEGPLVFLAGLLPAYLMHSLFNQFLLSPSLTTMGLLISLPVMFLLVFQASERALHGWLGIGFDTDQLLLQAIHEGRVRETRAGRYLEALKTRFPPASVVDMLCYLRLHLELSIRAKGVLLMQRAGFDAPPDPEVEARLRELAYLERSVGRTGMLALSPILNMSRRDLWQFHMLGRR